MIASHGGLNLYIGNNPDADGTYHHVAGVRPTIMDRQKMRDRSSERRFILRQGVELVCEQIRRRSLHFSPARSLNVQSDRSRAELQLCVFHEGRGIAAEIPGSSDRGFCFLSESRCSATPAQSAFRAVGIIYPAYAISVAIFFVSSRYRLPLLIPMCITAGAMFVQPRVWTWLVAISSAPAFAGIRT